MKMNKREQVYKITAILLMIDQFIKLLINSKMHLYQEIVIIKNFFSLFYVKNTGAAFSIFEDGVVYLSILSVIFILVLDRYIKKEIEGFNKYDIVSFGMILGGIFGNLIDRIIHHGVIDYLSFSFYEYQFPVFNFADMCIVLGVMILIFNTFMFKKG